MYGHVITKFSRMGSLPHFLTHGAPLRDLRYDLQTKGTSKTVNQLSLKGVGSLRSEKSYF